MKTCTSPTALKRPSVSNGSDLDVSSGMARKGLILMLGLGSLAAGCKDAEAIRDEIAALPHVTPTEIVNSPVRYIGKKVAVEGKVTFHRDASYNYTITNFTPLTVGDMTIYIPYDTTHTQTQLWYNIAPQKTGSGSLWVLSETQLNPDTVVVAGKIRQASDGGPYLEHQYSLYTTAEQAR